MAEEFLSELGLVSGALEFSGDAVTEEVRANVLGEAVRVRDAGQFCSLLHDLLDHAALAFEHGRGGCASPDELPKVSLEVHVDERDRPGLPELRLAHMNHVPREISSIGNASISSM